MIEKEILHRAGKEREGGELASDSPTLVISDVAYFVLNKKQLWSCSFHNESFLKVGWGGFKSLNKIYVYSVMKLFKNWDQIFSKLSE